MIKASTLYDKNEPGTQIVEKRDNSCRISSRPLRTVGLTQASPLQGDGVRPSMFDGMSFRKR